MCGIGTLTIALSMGGRKLPTISTSSGASHRVDGAGDVSGVTHQLYRTSLLNATVSSFRGARPEVGRVLSDRPVTVASVSDALIQARDLAKRFGPVEAVRGIDLDVGRGEVFGFLGPNGAGKSSAMRMIACVSPRTGGTLQVLGMDPDVQGPAIRARIGVVPQQDNLDLELTVRQNLEIYGRYFGLSRGRARVRATELLEFARLTDRSSSEVEPLSGGMRRRLTIARALVNDPELLLLDEPTTGLDPQARHLLWDRLYRLKQRGVTQLITTHYMDEAEQLCDRLVVMDQGLISAEGSPADLIERYSTREVVELRYAPDAPRPDLTGLIGPAGPAERVEELPDRVLVYAADGDRALRAALADGVHPAASLVRRSSLEDVFLRLTGRSLAD
jgi:lipooligosaccharide transport system ATP-binding protein